MEDHHLGLEVVMAVEDMIAEATTAEDMPATLPLEEAIVEVIEVGQEAMHRIEKAQMVDRKICVWKCMKPR